MVSVPASEIQKNFGEWNDRALQAPVQITKYGRTSTFLVSGPLFKAMWASFRQALPASELSATEVDLILGSEMAAGESYNLDDIPDLETEFSGPKL
ncbi:type II toxin-antitoxin system Phd/YefM family antitoxin [Mesorhizobium sp. LCM 4576]|uniref:type II toxin-antitoxin system Phd/YefM family antitoxin n=1 Tax=Mesorhizobium sp. LCM 4576 TaxID=1848289 RepID=UPI0010424B6F|nr:type II toxin-antitoxin system Phd/YefM family antitoxin [Mesorhizobium sp. LCM 4576]